ncbi:MAG: DUF362 domain-containing protein [Candidatus Methanomethylicia archaeon]
MEKIDVGVIGCGMVLEMFHLPATRNIPYIKVRALADVDEKRIMQIISKFGLEDVKTYIDYHQLLMDDLDAVWIFTPHNLHARMIVDALNSGKHVLCEKPLATCMEEIKVIEKTLKYNESQNLILMPAHNLIFTPCFEKAVEYIIKGEIGEIKEIYSKVTTNLLLYRAVTDFRFKTNSGVIEDLIPHTIYLSQDICGPITKIKSIKPHFKSKAVIEEVDIEVEFQNNAKGILSAAWSNGIPTCKFEVRGSLGSLYMDLFRAPYNLILIKDGERKTINMGYRFTQYFRIFNHPSYVNEHIHFANLINGLAEPRVDVEKGFETCRALDMIIRSLSNGNSNISSNNEKVSIVRVINDVDESIRRSINLLGGLKIQRDSKVVIKPNICFWKNTDGMIITDPRILESVLKMVREYTSKIIVVESDNNSGTAEKRVKKSGIMDIIEENDAEFINLSRDENEEHDVAGFKIHIPKTVLNAEYFINIPKIKTCGVENLVISIAMKNMFGVLSDKKKMEFHKRIMEIILYVNKIVRQDLIIVDGIIGMEGLGPVLGKPVKLDLIVSGFNPVTIDSVCCRIMDINPYAVETLWRAYKMGMGEINLENISVLGENIDYVKRKFSRPRFVTNNIIGALRAAFKTYF